MDNEFVDNEKQLKELCDIMISALDNLKTAGKISDDEYSEHIKMKKDFLENTKSE